MPTYTIRLRGLGPRAEGIPGTLAENLLATIGRSTRGAVRLRLEGRSSADGPAPRWLQRASDFNLVKLSRDFPGMVLYAPSLEEAIPDRFSQIDLFPELDPSKSALALMTESLAEAVGGRRESDRFDEALLREFESFESVLKQGVDCVQIGNGDRSVPAVQINPAGLRTIGELHRTTPQPRRVRLAGRMNVIRYNDRGFTLVLDSGVHLRGVLASGDPEQLANLFEKLALVSGTAHFRPSGSVLRVDADWVAQATEQDSKLWSATPRPLDAPLDVAELRKPQGPRSGINAIIGKWPGNESDEEILAALDRL